jgi:hypothetical protein
MDANIENLKRHTIKELKRILKALSKEPQNVSTLVTIAIIQKIIAEKKKMGTVLHPTRIKGRPIHLDAV